MNERHESKFGIWPLLVAVLVIGAGVLVYMAVFTTTTDGAWNKSPGPGLTALAVKLDGLSSREKDLVYDFLQETARQYCDYLDKDKTTPVSMDASMHTGTFGTGYARIEFVLDEERQDLDAIRKEFAVKMEEFCVSNSIKETIEVDVVK